MVVVHSISLILSSGFTETSVRFETFVTAVWVSYTTLVGWGNQARSTRCTGLYFFYDLVSSCPIAAFCSFHALCNSKIGHHVILNWLQTKKKVMAISNSHQEVENQLKRSFVGLVGYKRHSCDCRGIVCHAQRSLSHRQGRAPSIAHAVANHVGHNAKATQHWLSSWVHVSIHNTDDELLVYNIHEFAPVGRDSLTEILRWQNSP